MPHWSKSPPADMQRRAEDLVSTAGECCDADGPEALRLAMLDRETPADSPLRPVVDWLLWHDRSENAAHQLVRIIAKAFAGGIEAVNALAWRLRKRRALSPATNSGPQTRTNHRNRSTNPQQLTLFGGIE